MLKGLIRPWNSIYQGEDTHVYRFQGEREFCVSRESKRRSKTLALISRRSN